MSGSNPTSVTSGEPPQAVSRLSKTEARICFPRMKQYLNCNTYTKRKLRLRIIQAELFSVVANIATTQLSQILRQLMIQCLIKNIQFRSAVIGTTKTPPSRWYAAFDSPHITHKSFGGCPLSASMLRLISIRLFAASSI